MLNLNPQGFDTVYQCCGQQEAIDQAIELLKPGGQLIIVGIPEKDGLVFNAHQMRRKEITIQNVRRQNVRFEEALELLQGSLQIKNGSSTNENYDMFELTPCGLYFTVSIRGL